MKKETNNETVNYGELILKFIKSLPQVTAPYGGKRWSYRSILDIFLSGGVGEYEIHFDVFGERWMEVSVSDVNKLEYYLYGVNNIDLNGNLKEIYTIIEANKEDIIKAFSVDNSTKITNLKEQINRLNNELKQLENNEKG